MTKVKVLVLLAVMALFLTIPAVTFAQQVPPHVFVGTATVDDAAAADGTSVTAWVDGAQAGAGTVSGGRYSLLVDQGEGSFAGETISFMVGGFDAAETATWEQGGATGLDLTASRFTGGVVAAATTLAPLDVGNNLEIASSFNYNSAEYEAYVPGLANNTLTEVRPNSVIIVTLANDTTVVVSGVSFGVGAGVATPLPVSATVTIMVQ